MSCGWMDGWRRWEERRGGPPDVVTRILFHHMTLMVAREALHVVDSWLSREMIWSIMWSQSARESPVHQEMSLRDAHMEFKNISQPLELNMVRRKKRGKKKKQHIDWYLFFSTFTTGCLFLKEKPYFHSTPINFHQSIKPVPLFSLQPWNLSGQI